VRITKLLAAVIGVPMVVGSFALVIGGAVALALPDDDGWLSTGPIRMSTDAVALVGEDIEVELGSHVDDGRTFVGWDAIPARLEATSRNDKPVFIGIADEAAADAYLAGVAVARVDSFGHDPRLDWVGGAGQIATPGDQDIWVASSDEGRLDWEVTDGDWTIVVLNADGSAGVDVALTGEARIPFLGVIGIVLVIVGISGIALGSVLTYFGVRRVREPDGDATAPLPAQPSAV
jgi:hypothetical protein